MEYWTESEKQKSSGYRMVVRWCDRGAGWELRRTLPGISREYVPRVQEKNKIQNSKKSSH